MLGYIGKRLLELTEDSTESYTLTELTELARAKAKGARNLDKRSVRCVLLTTDNFLCRDNNTTHCHASSFQRGKICLQPSELLMPKKYQEWLISHEVTHLHTQKGHNNKSFTKIVTRLAGPNERELYYGYWVWRRQHRSEIRSKLVKMRFVASKPKSPKQPIPQSLIPSSL